MQIREDDLTGEEVVQLIHEHLRNMRANTPPKSCHALGLEALKSPEITFWTAWEDAELLGCAALKELDARTGEIKSMRTAERQRRKGVAAFLLEHIIAEATQRGYERLNLETGASADFTAARSLYARHGFTYRGPFADYKDDPNSVFMTKALNDSPG